MRKCTRAKLLIHRTTIAFLLLTSYLSPAATLATKIDKIDKKTLMPTEKGEKRTIQFPKDYSIGSLLLLQDKLDTTLTSRASLERAVRAAKAQGKVTVFVPEGNLLVLDANAKLFQNPECLKEVSTAGIDGFRLKHLAMTEDEDGQCDKALLELPRFKDVQFVDVTLSDASDVGLSNLKTLKKLKCVVAWISAARGKCLKDFQSLPELSNIEFSQCAIDQANLTYLAKIPKLTSLSLGRANIDVQGIIHLSKCVGLRHLFLPTNPKIDDACADYLLSLKNLESLDLRGSNITFKGLKKLSALSLKQIILPRSFYSNGELAELKKSLPSATLSVEGKEVNKETKSIFAPVSRER